MEVCNVVKISLSSPVVCFPVFAPVIVCIVVASVSEGVDGSTFYKPSCVSAI